MACLFMASSALVNAQTPGTGQRTGSATSASGGTKKQQANRPTQSHGSRDTTPGSPMGTGGAGGGDMSGSPAGSAIQTHDQTDKANANRAKPGGQKAASSTRKATKTKKSS